MNGLRVKKMSYSVDDLAEIDGVPLSTIPFDTLMVEA